MIRPKAVNRLRCLLVLLCLGCLPAACTTATVNYQAKSFTSQAISTDAISIAGITCDRSVSLSRGQRRGIASDLAASLRKKRKDVTLSNASARYKLSIHIRENHTGYWVDEDCETDTEEITDSEGEVIGCTTETTYTTMHYSGRTMSVIYEIHDRETGKLVWEAEANQSKSHCRSECSSFSYPSPPPAPDPPAVIDVMHSNHMAAIRALPKKRLLRRG